MTHIVLLGQVEQFANVVGTLRSQTAGDGIVGEAWYGVGANFGHDEVEDGNVLSDDASTDGFAFAFSGTALAVALVSLLTEEADACVGEDSLAHREALFVVSSGDAEDVAFELLAEGGAVNFLGYAAFVEVLEFYLIFDFDYFLES